MGVILKTLLLTSLPAISVIYSCSQTPHALVEIVDSPGAIIGFSDALLLEYFVSEMLVGSVNSSSVDPCFVASELAIEHTDSLSFACQSHLSLVHLVRQHEVSVLFKGEVDMVSQVHARHVVHDHRLRSQLAQKEVLVLAALPQELLLYFHIKVGLYGAHEERRVLRRRCDYFLQNLLAFDEVDLAVSEKCLLHLKAQVGNRVDDGQDFESREEQSDQGLVEDVLLF